VGNHRTFFTMLRYFIVLSALGFTACVKDKPVKASQSVNLSGARKVYVVNEGGFGSGNSSISLYDPGTEEVVEDFYFLQNNQALGDVTQSLSYINGNYYVVVNNSKKIVVCNREFKKTGQIMGFNSPRYILPITNQKAYVTDLYANSISVINLNSNAITGAIPCKGKTERMVMLYNKVFVTNTESNYLYVINAAKDLMEDSIYVGKWASSLVIDKNDKLWVLAGGEKPKIRGKLSRINPLDNQIEAAFDFGQDDSPNNLCINKNRDSLYFLNGNIYRILIGETALPTQAFVMSGGKNFYGLDVSPNDYCVYAADALLFTERSNIYRYSGDGSQKSMFKGVVNANGFYFE
jgi:DNA-binding beta-propeller fold protein YncE